ncbi:MAG: hypothetical protein QM765_30260 [Myxococcales bacterium]
MTAPPAPRRRSSSWARTSSTTAPRPASASPSCAPRRLSQETFCARTEIPAVCRTVLADPSEAKKQPPGGTCVHDSDCEGGSAGTATCFLAYDGSSDVKRCVSVVAPGASIPCIATLDGEWPSEISWLISQAGPVPTQASYCRRDQGFYCQTDSRKCVAVKKHGEDCRETHSYCQASDFCDWRTSTCVTRGAAGASCSSAEECDDTSYCDQDARKCAAPLAKGAACDLGDDCQAGTACLDGTCKGYSLALAATCVSR